jgi:lysozyme
MVDTVQSLIAAIVTWLHQICGRLLQTSTNQIKNADITGECKMQQKYKQMTKNFEGLRLRPYRCSANKLTIGYGRNLEDVGISKSEADMMFERDFSQAMNDVVRLLKEYKVNYDDVIEQRFYALTDMMFNLGYNNLSKFKKMLTAFSKGDYETAANEMLNSLWATQVGSRATQLAALMRG